MIFSSLNRDFFIGVLLSENAAPNRPWFSGDYKAGHGGVATFRCISTRFEADTDSNGD